MRPVASVRNLVHRGCRLLDYTRPESHEVVPRARYLLGLRAGARYDEAGIPELPELLTIFRTLERRPQWGDRVLPRKELGGILPPTARGGEDAASGCGGGGGHPPISGATPATPATPPKPRTTPTTDVPEPAIWPVLRQRLRLPPDTPFAGACDRLLPLVDGPLLKDLEAWVDCVVAPDLAAALDIIRRHPNARWPAHVVLYTYARRCSSAWEAHAAVRLLDTLLPELAPHLRPELTYISLRMVRKQLVDLVPTVIQLFLRHHHHHRHNNNNNPNETTLDAGVGNELVWQLAGYGSTHDAVDLRPLQDAQSLVVRAMGVDALDTKGFFGLCYVEHFREVSSPSSSSSSSAEGSSAEGSSAGGSSGSAALSTMEKHMHLNPRGAQSFAYTAGATVLRILGAPTAAHALAAAEFASVHRAQVWACCAASLARRGALTGEIAQELFMRARESRCLSAQLLGAVVSALPLFSQKLRCLRLAEADGFRLTPALVAAAARLGSARDVRDFEHEFHAFLSHPKVADRHLQTLSVVDPAHFWSAYTAAFQQQQPSRQPSRQVLAAMCRAAWDDGLVWDGLYAAQRATAEFKQHVRGVSAPSDDVLRVFPNETMLYAYVVMLGRAQYTNELVNCLEWITKLEVTPSKRVLLAIIHYSPQGRTLLRMGQSWPDWPTEEEYSVYRKTHS